MPKTANDVPGLVWHPEVHKHVGESLYYVFVNSYGLYRGIRNELANLQTALGRPCPAYITYGFQDLWLRFWARQDRVDAVYNYVRQRIAMGEGATLYIADPIWQIWGQQVLQLDSNAHAILDYHALPRLSSLQRDWPEKADAELAMSSGLILGELPFNSYADHDHIRVFFLIETIPNMTSDDVIANTIVRSVQGGPQPHSLVSLVRFSPTHIFVVELAVSDYWDIDRICDPIREDLNLVIVKTTTQLVTDIYFQETDGCDFSSRPYQILVSERILQRLFPEYQLLSDNRQSVITSFFRSWHIYWTNKLCRDLSERCLTGLITLQADPIEEAIGLVTPHIEPVLRDQVKRTAERRFGNLNFANIARMRPGLERKGWDRLALGDSVELLVVLGDQLNDTRLTAQAQQLRPFVPIRNQVHGGKLQGDWDAILEIVKVIDACFPALDRMLREEEL